MNVSKIKAITLMTTCVFIAVVWYKKTITDNVQLTQLQLEKIIFVNKHDPVKLPSLQIAVSSMPLKKNVPTTSSPADTQLEEAATKDVLIKNAESFNQWLLESSQTSTDFHFSNEIKKRFGQEDVDIYWAANEEAKLHNLFIDSPELIGVALTEVKCRTTQCELTIAITDIDQANQLIGQVNLALLQQGYKNLMVIAAPDEKRNITRLYISSSQTLFNYKL